MMRIFLILIVGAAWPISAAKTSWYEIDFAKSQISFVAKSRIANANGIFRKWTFKGRISGNLHVVGDVIIDCGSIDTDNDRRDNHLKNADFFDCEKYPQHVFRVRSIKADNAAATKVTKFEVEGDLTMHGTSHPVVFSLAREGDEAKFVLTGSTILDREKFGLTYNSALNPIEKGIRLDLRLVLNRRGDK